MTGPDVDLRRDSIPALVRQLPAAPVAVVDELVARLWRIGPAAVATVLIVGATIKEVLPPGPPVLSADAALYQHGGWYITVGGVPYVDIFDVKPPVAFELPAILALLTGGDPTLLYAASVFTTGAAAVAVVALVGTLVYDLTDDHWAALCAEVAVLAFSVLFWYPAKGFRPKLFVLAFGLGSLVLARRCRTASAGTLAALAAGTWQLGAFFPLAVCGLVWRRSGALGRALAAMAGTTVVVVAPIVLQGGTTAMVVEAVLIPLTDAEGQSLSFAVVKAIFLLGFAAPVVFVGTIGRARRPQPTGRVVGLGRSDLVRGPGLPRPRLVPRPLRTGHLRRHRTRTRGRQPLAVDLGRHTAGCRCGRRIRRRPQRDPPPRHRSVRRIQSGRCVTVRGRLRVRRVHASGPRSAGTRTVLRRFAGTVYERPLLEPADTAVLPLPVRRLRDLVARTDRPDVPHSVWTPAVSKAND